MTTALRKTVQPTQRRVLYFDNLRHAHGAAAVGIILALFVLFRQRFNRQGRLARFMSAHGYTVYIIHPLVLVALNHAFKGLHAISVVKFIVVAIAGIPPCWIAAYAVRSLPYAKRVL